MALNVWLLFVATVFFMSATPGPNMMLAMTHAMRYGRRRTTATCAGLMIGILFIMLGSMLGLGALLAASERLFTVVKYAGAAYLIFLGIKLWREQPGEPGQEEQPDRALVRAVANQNRGMWALFRTGLLVSLSNPKAFFFFTAFFPQFFNKAESQGLQLAILTATFVAIESLWLVIYVIGGQGASRYLGKPSRVRIVNRISGSVFIGLALLLTRAERS